MLGTGETALSKMYMDSILMEFSLTVNSDKQAVEYK